MFCRRVESEDAENQAVYSDVDNSRYYGADNRGGYQESEEFDVETSRHGGRQAYPVQHRRIEQHHRSHQGHYAAPSQSVSRYNGGRMPHPPPHFYPPYDQQSNYYEHDPHYSSNRCDLRPRTYCHPQTSMEMYSCRRDSYAKV